MNKFNRGSYMRERHRQSKRMFSYYKENVSEDASYSDFMRKDTPMSDIIVEYSVSYQLSYSGEVDEIKSKPYTFTVYGLRGEEVEIEKRTMNMLIDSKGGMTKENFNQGVIEKLEQSNNSNVRVLPRGMEQVKNSVERNNIVNFINSGNKYYTKELDTSIKFENKKGREGEMKLDTLWFEK